jgi:Na+-driven multidrug efflux pump
VQTWASADANNTTVLKRHRQQAAATVQPTVQQSSPPPLLGTSSAHDGDIMRLAVPALLALAADPLLGVIDTAFVGQLGGDNLVSCCAK